MVECQAGAAGTRSGWSCDRAGVACDRHRHLAPPTNGSRSDCNGRLVLDEEMVVLRSWWEETSYQLERLQINPVCADAEKANIYDRKGPTYHLQLQPGTDARPLSSRKRTNRRWPSSAMRVRIPTGR